MVPPEELLQALGGQTQLAHGSVLEAVCLPSACLLEVGWSLSGYSCSVLLGPHLLQSSYSLGMLSYCCDILHTVNVLRAAG